MFGGIPLVGTIMGGFFPRTPAEEGPNPNGPPTLRERQSAETIGEFERNLEQRTLLQLMDDAAKRDAAEEAKFRR